MDFIINELWSAAIIGAAWLIRIGWKWLKVNHLGIADAIEKIVIELMQEYDKELSFQKIKQDEYTAKVDTLKLVSKLARTEPNNIKPELIEETLKRVKLLEGGK